MPTARNARSPNQSTRRVVTKPSTRSGGGIVVTQNRVASEVGARVLKEGGNAIDAAVAAAFAIGVVEPWMSGIGGVGAMLYREAKTGRITALDFGCRSPKGLKVEDFPLAGGVDALNLFGWPAVVENRNAVGAKAIVAPTEPLGMALAHKMFGSKPWARLVEPAARLADEGMVVDYHTTLTVTGALADLANDPGSRERYLRNGLPPLAPPPQTGLEEMRLKAPALARTLRAIAADGAEVMYRGALAETIAGDVQALGGYLSLDDLASAKAVERQPLQQTYRGQTLSVLPELNGGPTLFQAFQHLAKHGGEPGAGPDG
ncbi:MAG: gamma-glutamyltransferase, partial [Proteobacteria bacterium]|nr:gamma-glutamyltransferase [Pseudomonadota bacterium]